MKHIRLARTVLFRSTLVAIALSMPPVVGADAGNGSVTATIPTLNTDNDTVNQAYRIAIGDILGNVVPFKDGLLDHPAPVLLAGLDYGTPWTRDASINAWNGASLLMPEVARHTLLSVLARVDGKVQIGGQYWDAIVWTIGAWHHYLYTGDRPFLALALEATKNSLAHFEQAEFDAKDGMSFGRHIGTVWPQIQGFWAEAAARAGKSQVFGHELLNLAAHAVRDKQFAEIYHPITGQVYGGLQEAEGRGIILWQATSRQTWAATMRKWSR